MDKRLNNVNLIKELDFTFVDVEKQLIEDEKRYGESWKEHGLVYNNQSQEERFFQKIKDYYDDYLEGIPINWAKVITEAHVCMVKEKILK